MVQNAWYHFSSYPEITAVDERRYSVEKYPSQQALDQAFPKGELVIIEQTSRTDPYYEEEVHYVWKLVRE